MSKRDIIVIGASAGGVDAMQRFCSAMPRSFSGSLFLTQHLSADARSVLPQLLSHKGPLPAFHPEDGEPIRPGHIHIAPPDRHLLLKRGHVLVRRGPPENCTRPAIDPMFRSAAVAYGARVVGMILTGTLGDGTAGLLSVQRCGGTTIVQDPADAAWPDMPRNALHKVDVDHCLPLHLIPTLLMRLAGETAGVSPPVPDNVRIETRIAEMELNSMNGPMPTLGHPSGMSCPACGGGLLEIHDGPLLRFRCHVGHGYSSEALTDEQVSGLERAFYVAMRTQNERYLLFRKMAEHAKSKGHNHSAARWEAAAREAMEHVEVLRSALPARAVPETDPEEVL